MQKSLTARRSIVQRADCRESRWRHLIALREPHPREASCRARRGRDGPKTVSYYGHRLVRARGRAQRCSPSERASQRAAARRSAQVTVRVARSVTAAPTVLAPSGRPAELNEAGAAPKAARRSGHQFMRATGRAQRYSMCSESHSTSQRAECREGRQRRYIASGVAPLLLLYLCIATRPPSLSLA